MRAISKEVINNMPPEAKPEQHDPTRLERQAAVQSGISPSDVFASVLNKPRSRFHPSALHNTTVHS